MFENELDPAIRLRAFEWLREQTQLNGPVLSRRLLEQGFIYGDIRIPLVSPQGIYKPKLMRLPLSITTAPNGPYSDTFIEPDVLSYKYRGTNPDHSDNVGLRTAMRENVPLIYLHGLAPGLYEPIWPVYIVGDDKDLLSFRVVADAAEAVQPGAVTEDAAARRAYVTGTVKRRLHQNLFRERVLAAYNTSCTLCNFKHKQLLEASHIIPDSDPDGEPLVTNGLSLCTFHHSAFDGYLISISPDYQIHVRADILEEEDGPMLKHGLQGVNGKSIILPKNQRNWPDREALERRFEEFRRRG